MEAVNGGVQQEGVEERGRRPDLADPSGEISRSSGENNATAMNDGCKSEEEEVDKNDTLKNSVYYDKNEGIWKCHHCIWRHKHGHPWIDHVHQKSFSHGNIRGTTLQLSLSGKSLKAEDHVNISELMKAVINHQNGGNCKDELVSGSSTSTLRSEEQNKGNRKTVTVDLEEGSDEEIEVEFKRAVEKVHTHTPLCPNCRNVITKVILRRKRKDSPRPVEPHVEPQVETQVEPQVETQVEPQVEPQVETQVEPQVDAFGCLQCLSVFIPSGNRLNPFRFFGWKGKQDITEVVSAGGTPSDEGTTTAVKPGGVQVKPSGESSEGEPHPSLPVGHLAIYIPPETGNRLNPFRFFGWKGKQDSTEDVSAGGSTTAEGSTTAVKPGKQDITEDVSAGGPTTAEGSTTANLGGDQVKPDGESSNEGENFNKPGRRPEATPPHPSLPIGHVSIYIPPETDGGISDGVTAPMKTGGEIKEEHGDKSPRHQEPDEENHGETTPGELGQSDPRVAEKPEFPSTHGSRPLEILKCIVYGGLIESITSLSVVSSAAASDASTLNVIAIGLATVFSGLIVFGRNLVGLNNDVSGDRYQEQLGTRGKFLLHATFAILSYLVFGLLPPITYGFTFRESDNKDYKILAVAAASFASIFVLAVAKAYVRKLEKFGYVKTVLGYITMAISVSGVSYAAGDLIRMLMEKLGWFEPTQAANTFFPEMISATPAWASY